MEGRKHVGVVMRLVPHGDAAWEDNWRGQALPAGVYIVQLETDTGVSSIRALKIR